MTHHYSKPIRKKLQELVGLAHERELGNAMEDDFLVCRAVKLGFCPGKMFQRKWPRPSFWTDLYKNTTGKLITLFFWFFLVFSDFRNVNKREVDAFPIDLKRMEIGLKDRRLLFLSPFNENQWRISAKRSHYRNLFVAAMSAVIFVIHAEPSSKTEELCRQILSWQKPIYTFESNYNKNLIEMGARPVNMDKDLVRKSIFHHSQFFLGDC